MSTATILVVDDDPQIREVLSVALDRAGFRTVTARDGAEGLSRAQSARPDDVSELAMGMALSTGIAPRNAGATRWRRYGGRLVD